MYIIGRVSRGKFESYRGWMFTSRSKAREVFEEEFDISREAEWTVYEARDTLAHLHPNQTARADQQ